MKRPQREEASDRGRLLRRILRRHPARADVVMGMDDRQDTRASLVPIDWQKLTIFKECGSIASLYFVSLLMI